MLVCGKEPGQGATQAIICTTASANALNSGVNVHFRGAMGDAKAVLGGDRIENQLMRQVTHEGSPG